MRWTSGGILTFSVLRQTKGSQSYRGRKGIKLSTLICQKSLHSVSGYHFLLIGNLSLLDGANKNTVSVNLNFRWTTNNFLVKVCHAIFRRYLYQNILVTYLKFKINGASCVLSGKHSYNYTSHMYIIYVLWSPRAKTSTSVKWAKSACLRNTGSEVTRRILEETNISLKN